MEGRGNQKKRKEYTSFLRLRRRRIAPRKRETNWSKSGQDYSNGLGREKGKSMSKLYYKQKPKCQAPLRCRLSS